MTTSVSGLAPANLGTADSPDPFAIQPGSILVERFCVIGRVRHGAVGWRVSVTDLERTLGSAPHHRLDLVVLPTDAATERLVRRALPAYQVLHRRVHATFGFTDELGLLVNPVESPSLELPLDHDELRAVTSTVGGILSGLHRSGLSGARLRPRHLRLDSLQRCQVAEWTHLLDLTAAAGPAECARDLECFEDLLRGLGAPEALFAQPAQTPADLLQRLDARPTLEARAPAAILPAIPPFVGRRNELRTVHQAVAKVRQAGPAAIVVRGPRGSGRSRFIDQLALELQRGEGALPIALPQTDHSHRVLGIASVMQQLANVVDALPWSERDAIGQRITQQIGPLTGLVAYLDSRLGSLVGQAPPIPRLPLDQRFVRHAATAAHLLSAVGTSTRPLVLLIDDLHLADASMRALLYHLLVPSAAHATTVVLTSRTAVDLPRPVVEVHLPEFGLDEVEHLVQQCLPGPVQRAPDIAAALALVSPTPEGAWEALQSAVRAGRLARGSGGWRIVEDPDRGSIIPFTELLRWDHLEADAQQLATLLAVRSAPAAREWVCNVTQWTVDEVDRAATKLVSRRAGYLDMDGLLRLASDRIRSRVLEQAGEEARRTAHQQISRWLRRLGREATESQRAWHQEHGTAGGTDQDLARLHIEAGRELLRTFDADRAKWHFDRALERQEGSSLHQQALEGRADALMLLDQV